MIIEGSNTGVRFVFAFSQFVFLFVLVALLLTVVVIFSVLAVRVYAELSVTTGPHATPTPTFAPHPPLPSPRAL